MVGDVGEVLVVRDFKFNLGNVSRVEYYTFFFLGYRIG